MPTTVTATIDLGFQPEAVAVGAGAVWATHGGPVPGPAEAAAGSYEWGDVVRIDPATNQIVASVGVFGALAVGEGSVWVADDPVARIDPATNQVVATIDVGDQPSAVAVGEGAVWVARYDDGSVARIDPASNQIVATIPLYPQPDPQLAPDTDLPFDPSRRYGTWGPLSIAVGEGAVWVVDGLSLMRIDPATNAITGTIDMEGGPGSVAVGEGSVWVVGRVIDGLSLGRIDPATNQMVATVDVGDQPTAVAVGEGSVWVAVGGDDAAVRVDPATNQVTTTIQVGDGPDALAIGEGSVWVVNRHGRPGDEPDTGSLSRIE